MRESCTSGSVRGASSDRRLYSTFSSSLSGDWVRNLDLCIGIAIEILLVEPRELVQVVLSVNTAPSRASEGMVWRRHADPAIALPEQSCKLLFRGSFRHQPRTAGGTRPKIR
jgi:hypothetical protein